MTLKFAAILSSSAVIFVPSAMAQNSVIPPATTADEPGQSDIVVTANRRVQDPVKIPYNITAVGGEQLARLHTTDLAQLANQVPGFSLKDRGARYAGSSVPIIRGLNASNTDRQGLVQEQAPVATYIGNSAVSGYFPLDDIQRVEVLRGPQGTLYGAGALGGAIRIIPADPEIGNTLLEVTGIGTRVAHSADTGYSAGGRANLPIGDTLAFRISGKYEHQAGFIDQFGIVRRDGDRVTGLPAPQSPGDPNSRAVYYTRRDGNYTEVGSFRAALRFKPSDRFSATLAASYTDLHGNGGPTSNRAFKGGAYFIDPRVDLPSGGDYRLIQPTVEPFQRKSKLGSLDMSYDFGFATLSSTTSYYDTHGDTAADETLAIFNLSPVFQAYYTGNPVSPRYVNEFIYGDRTRDFAQEVRLVSKSGGVVDYVLGAYYEHQKQDLLWNIYAPGAESYNAAVGGVIPFTDDLGRQYTENSHQRFTDRSVFGELTWHATSEWDITGGARFFWQSFSQDQGFQSFAFNYGSQNQSKSKVSDHIFKVNSSYEFSHNQRIYATFSQGFRRGGANAFPTVGGLAEPENLITYAPDKVNNYEIGLKGILPAGVRYAIDGFWIDWTNPQIGTSTVNGFPVVINAPKAQSRGFEFEISTPLFARGLSLTAAYAFADATLKRDFCYTVGNGAGGTIPCGISGVEGSRTPGSPRHSASATLDYTWKLGGGDSVSFMVNGTYKGSIISNLPRANANVLTLSDYLLLNGAVTLTKGPVTLGLFANNLTDRRSVVGTRTNLTPALNNLDAIETITSPRTIGLRVSYRVR